MKVALGSTVTAKSSNNNGEAHSGLSPFLKEVKMQLPRYVDNLPVSKFKKFLVNCGGQLLHETNEYEVVRLQCEKTVEILYRKLSGF